MKYFFFTGHVWFKMQGLQLYCSLFQRKNLSYINWSCDFVKSRSSDEKYCMTQRRVINC